MCFIVIAYSKFSHEVIYLSYIIIYRFSQHNFSLLAKVSGAGDKILSFVTG